VGYCCSWSIHKDDAPAKFPNDAGFLPGRSGCTLRGPPEPAKDFWRDDGTANADRWDMGTRRLGEDLLRTALLVCGIVSSALYGAMIWAIRYEGYSLVSQVPSELTAIGAPTERVWTFLGPLYTALVVAFGWGVRQSAGHSRALRIVGDLIFAFGCLGLLWPFAQMHRREVLAAGGGTLSDTLHLALGGIAVLLMFLAIGVGATAFGSRFRLYSILSVVVLLTFGALTFVEAPRLQANLPTPWIGLWERINISVFLLWIVVLATLLLHASHGSEAGA
jgi:hypothetical protein